MTDPSREFDSLRPGPRADIPFVVIALASGGVLLYLGRAMSFWEDEWRSITFDGGLADYLRPVNQHWSTFPLLLYRLTFQVVELRSYLPYLAEVIVLHLLAVAGAYAVMRTRVGPVVATLVAIPLLFLGTGAENLFWAFQTGFVGSVMFGAWALFFIERQGPRAPLIPSLLLLGSLASSGMGLFFLVVAAGRTIFDSSLRSRALAVAPPFAVYVLWFALVGHDAVGGGRLYIEPSTARFAIRGVVYSTERISGLDHLPDGHLWGLLLFLGLSLLTGLRMVRGRPHALAAGCLLGVAAMYSVIAFGRVRADPGYDHATSSRFVYVAAFLLVLAVVDLLARSSWSAQGRRAAVVAPVALLLALACATAANVDALVSERSEFRQTADSTRAFIAVALARGHEPWVDRDVPRGWMPSVSELERTIERHGSPLRDELFPGLFGAPDAAAKEAAVLALIGDGFRVEVPHGRLRVAPVESPNASFGTSKEGRCVRARFGPDAAVWILGLPAGTRVRVSAQSELDGRLFLAHQRGPARRIFADFEPGVPRDIVIPDVGDGRPWKLGLDSPASPGNVKLCVLLPDSNRTIRASRVTVRPWE